MPKTIKFWLNGCDIAFTAEAPADMTVEQLIRQCDRIRPDWCACGIKSWEEGDGGIDLIFDYEDVDYEPNSILYGTECACKIKEKS